jgi:hypothetical protein
MKNIDDLLDAVKKVLGSDNQLGMKLGTGGQLVNNWRGRRSMPSNKHIIEMCKLANVKLDEAILAVEYSREYERPLKEAGFGHLEMVTGIGAISAMSLLIVSQHPAIAELALFVGANTVYYVK